VATHHIRPERSALLNRILAAALAAATAASMAACSGPAAASGTPSSPQVTAATAAPPAATETAAAPSAAATTPAPTRSPGPGSVKAEPGEDVYDFNVRQDFWAQLQKNGSTAGRYESDTYRQFMQEVGYTAVNLGMDVSCTLGARISVNEKPDAAAMRWLHEPAKTAPGVKLFTYPVLCPNGRSPGHPRNYVLLALVNPQLKVEELNYVPDGPDTVPYGVPDSNKL